jgi:hypothetical protein
MASAVAHAGLMSWVAPAKRAHTTVEENEMLKNFWSVIDEQLAELKTAKTAADVVRVLSHERNPYGDPTMAGSCDAFFAGSGGDETVRGALYEAGWSFVKGDQYFYVMRAPGGDEITYCEGDIFVGGKGAGMS